MFNAVPNVDSIEKLSGLNLNAVYVTTPITFHFPIIKAVYSESAREVGFQMNPSKEECEKVLVDFPEPTVIAISILAAGYLSPLEAIDYIGTLPNVRGIVVGVSKEKHAYETFRLLRERLAPRAL